MSQTLILTAAAPTWIAVVFHDASAYAVTKMPVSAVLTLRKELLVDAQLIVGSSVEEVNRILESSCHGYRRVTFVELGLA